MIPRYPGQTYPGKVDSRNNVVTQPGPQLERSYKAKVVISFLSGQWMAYK